MANQHIVCALKIKFQQLRAVAALAIFWMALSTGAHPMDIAYVQIEQQADHLNLNLDLHPSIIADILHLDPVGLQKLDSAELMQKFASVVFDSGSFQAGGQSCQFRAEKLEIKESNSLLSGEIQCPQPPRDLLIRLQFFNGLQKSYQILGRAVINGHESVFTLNEKQDAYQIQLSEQRNFLAFVQLGLEHIGAWPNQWHDSGGWRLPDGIDHIIFLIGLLLIAAQSLRKTVLMITGFTLGHSLTLGLALLKVISLPAFIVEPAIALTIALVGAEILWWKREMKRPWLLPCVFGLVHGLGFAASLGVLNVSNLGHLISALLGFNLGIEMGQLFFALVFIPLLIHSLKFSWYKRFAVPTLACLIMLLGTYWFVIRLIPIFD